MEHAVDYIIKEHKAFSLETMKKHLNSTLDHLNSVNTSFGERATYINCSSLNTYKDFENLRRAFDQDKGVIAHHYYQSFQKDDNVTPEQAHQIGVELAKKMFPNFQVVVATHIDREHLHNHIIVNSCNMITGRKWHSNKQSLAEIRKESDKLCMANGLGTIKKNNKYKGIDRTTYQLGLKGKSWKIKLIRDLNNAVESCKNKDEFLSFLKSKDYSVRYTERHITITKNGEKKGIRVDTLAKQFGEKYTKENLEKKMGYYSPEALSSIKLNENKKTYKECKDTVPKKSNWNYYEEWVFQQNNYNKSTPQHIVRDKHADYLIKRAENKLLYSRNIADFILRAFILLLALSQRKKKKAHTRYRTVRTLPIQKSYSTFGNINYRDLVQSTGDNYSVKVTLDKLLCLAGQPVLYSAKVDKNSSTVTITVKEKDKHFLAELIGLSQKQKQLDEQSEDIHNRKVYKEIKEAAEQSSTKLQYLVITEEQKQILQDNYIQFAYFPKDDKINIAFLPEKADIIKRLIYPKQQNKITETPQQKNNRVYAELKKSAALTGEKLHYKVKLTKQQLEALSKTDITFAYFTNKDDNNLFNIAYDRASDSKVKETLAALNNQKLS